MSDKLNLDREKFSSRLGFLLITAGCAIGLGNVWRFPYITGQYGGSLFVIVYILFLLLLGIPLVTIELSVGRASRKSVGYSFETLTPNTKWYYSKYFMILGNYVLMGFYSMVTGWMLYYTYKMFSGEFTKEPMLPQQSGQFFGQMLGSPVSQIVCLLIVTVIAFSVCAFGLRKGVEKITKPLMVLLFLLLIFLAVHALRMPGCQEGLSYYLKPDFERFSQYPLSEVLSAACGQAFFTLGVGIGSIQIFGSYMSKNKAIVNESITIAVLDTIVALLAGCIIFPACFSFNLEPGQGPGLIFVTLVSVFSHMEYGIFWGGVFFLFMLFAAISTLIAVFENIVKMTHDATEWERKKCVLVNLIGVAVLSIPAVLGYNILSGIQPLGAGSTIMDLEDFIVSYNILPLGSILFVLFCVRKNGWGWDNFVAEVNTGKGMSLSHKLRWYMNYIVPTLGILIYLGGYYDMFKKSSPAVFIMCMTIAVLLVAGILAIAFHKGKKTE